MIVTVKPHGREEYALRLDGLPVYSSSAQGGYEQAQIPCQLPEAQRPTIKGARLRIHGASGIVWQGIVTRRPTATQPLLALGWGWCATLGRREAPYCDTSLNTWEPSSQWTPAGWGAGMGVADLDVTIAGGATYAQYTKVLYNKAVPTTGACRISGNVTSLPDAKLEILVYTSSTRGTLGTLRQTLSTTGSFTVDVTAAGIRQVSILVRTNDSYTPATDKQVTIGSLKYFGVQGVTSATTGNVIRNIVDNEIATTFLPAGEAYRAWLTAEGTAIEPLVFDPASWAAAKIEEITKYVPYSYGWYMEMVAGQPACVPHWTQRSWEPDYILRIDDTESHDIEESTLPELISAARVNYSTEDGKSAYVDVADTDQSHPLVKLGIVRYGDVSAQTSSSATAASIGALAVAEGGRERVKGAVVTRVLRTVGGAAVYLPDVRPGRMVRVFGLEDGQRDCMIRRVTCRGESEATVETDDEPYRLDLRLARLTKRELFTLPSPRR